MHKFTLMNYPFASQILNSIASQKNAFFNKSHVITVHYKWSITVDLQFHKMLSVQYLNMNKYFLLLIKEPKKHKFKLLYEMYSWAY